MKKLFYLLFGLVVMIVVASCSDTETYADQKEAEVKAIKKYLSDSSVTVISEDKFFDQDSTTDVSRNEYVLFESSGVYMQIIRKGCGSKIADGETASVLCRFTEWNLETDSVQLSNNVLSYSSLIEKFIVKNSSGTFEGSFVSGSSVMYSVYGSQAVPGGWLVPLTYINIGRPTQEGDETAKVKIIVPHTQGQYYASQNVYPCLYEITYQRGK